MINIIIVEDHTLFRKGIRSLLASNEKFNVVAEFSNGQDYIDNISNFEVDIVLMDIEMPLLNGIEATKQSKVIKPEVLIIALSMYAEKKYYAEMIKAGVSGFVLKEASPEELEIAIFNVYQGLGYFSPELLQQAIIFGNKKEKVKTQISNLNLNLTDREMQILALICLGLTDNEISDKIFISPRTVETHRSKLLQKTNTKNTVNLILYAIKNSLVDI